MTKRIHFLHFGILACILFSSQVVASGSFSMGSSGGFADSYNLGKVAVHKKLICSSCPLKNKALNTTNAKSIILDIKENSDTTNILSSMDRKNIIVYLQKRFDI